MKDTQLKHQNLPVLYRRRRLPIIAKMLESWRERGLKPQNVSIRGIIEPGYIHELVQHENR